MVLIADHYNGATKWALIFVLLYPAEAMQACTIAKDFREVLEPTKPFEYEDVPALELALA